MQISHSFFRFSVYHLWPNDLLRPVKGFRQHSLSPFKSYSLEAGSIRFSNQFR